MSHTPNTACAQRSDRVDATSLEQDDIVPATPILVEAGTDYFAITVAAPDGEPIMLAFGNEDINDWLRILNEEKAISNGATFETATSLANGSVATAYLNKRGQNTGVTYGTWSGEKPDQDDHVALIVHRDTVVDMIRKGPQLVSINPACVEANARAAQAAQAKRKAEQQARAKREAREREERDIVLEITGKDRHPSELQDELVLAYREGRDTQRWIDAMKALDDLELKRAGLTSWSVDLDDEEDEK